MEANLHGARALTHAVQALKRVVPVPVPRRVVQALMRVARVPQTDLVRCFVLGPPHAILRMAHRHCVRRHRPRCERRRQKNLRPGRHRPLMRRLLESHPHHHRRHPCLGQPITPMA
jgi:hypothetical protein